MLSSHSLQIKANQILALGNKIMDDITEISWVAV